MIFLSVRFVLLDVLWLDKRSMYSVLCVSVCLCVYSGADWFERVFVFFKVYFYIQIIVSLS
jgi:hypothetical protein